MSLIRGVLLAGKFRTQDELNTMSTKDLRNTLIVELSGRTNQSGAHFQSLDDASLAGTGAVLVFLRETKIRDDAALKTMSTDDQRNTLIVVLQSHFNLPASQFQGLSNMDLVLVGLGSDRATKSLVPGIVSSFIGGVLLAGKFRTYGELNGMSHDGQRNTLIVELSARTNQSVAHFQSFNDAVLEEKGAVLVFLREAKIRNDGELKSMSDDDQRNVLIVVLQFQTNLPVSQLQSLSNMDLVLLGLGCSVSDCHNVVTQHNDNSRTGAYLHESTLRPAVLDSLFRRVAEREVDGSPCAQILYVRGVQTPIGTKNIAIVATSTNMVYAFDADDHRFGAQAGLAWQTGPLGPTRSLTKAEICRETHGPVGITSTPAIDTESQTIYVVARHWNSTIPGQPGQSDLGGDHFLHALKLTDGTPRYDPRKIEGTDPRTKEAFDPRVQRNRPGLLLLRGNVYVGFGTFSCDGGFYRGWIFGYTASGLHPAAIFCTTSGEPHAAGIWQSGNGLVGADEGFIYFETGNESRTDGHPNRLATPLADSFVRLRVVPGWPGLQLDGQFQPKNAAVLREGDTDLGSGGPVLLPGGRLVGGGKQGRLYVLDSASMAPTQNKTSPDLPVIGEGFQAFVNQYDRHYQTLADAAEDGYRNYAKGELAGPNIHGGPCYWQDQGLLFHMSEKDDLKSFSYDPLSGHLREMPAQVATGSHKRPPDGMPGGHSSLSANGDRDGIVWTCVPTSDGQWAPAHGVLVAFDAVSLKQIWSDEQSEWFAKFNPPTIADGKVFRPVFAQYAFTPGLHVGEHHKPSEPLDDDGVAPLEIRPGRIIIYGLLSLRELDESTTLVPDKPPHAIPPVASPVPDKPPHGIRHWYSWVGGGDPRPLLSLTEKRDRHFGSGALVAPIGPVETLGDGGERQDFMGWIPTRHGAASVRADNGHGGSCHNPPRTTIPLTSSLFWSGHTGAHMVLGEIRDEYLRHGGPAGPLGYPTSDEHPADGHSGRASQFEHGAITWEPSSGPKVVFQTGGTASVLGIKAGRQPVK